MRAKGPIVFLLLAILLAGAAAWGAHVYLSGRAALTERDRMATRPVVVAARRLEPGQELESSVLALRRWPADSLPQGGFQSLDDLKGRVLSFPTAAGQAILASMLAPPGSKGGLSAVVPAGYRAMTVKVDEVIGVGGYLQPGDRVDVVATLGQSGALHEDPAAATVIYDVPVLTAGEKTQTEGKGGKASANKFKTVTLQVTPEQAERLALAAAMGKVVMSLRNQADQAPPDTNGVRLTSLVPAAAAPPAPPADPPQAAPAPPETGVEVIKGVTKSVQVM